MKRSLAAGLTFLGVLVPTAYFCLAQDGFPDKPRKVTKTDEEWAKQLTRQQFLVTRRKATEPAFSGKYVNTHAQGVFACVGCGAELFGSRAKFESGTGWPSFWRPIVPGRIDTAKDYDTAEPRVEVICQDCGAHLGHVFADGPPPTGLRYCINSAALKFQPSAATAKPSRKRGAPAAEKVEKPDPSKEDK